MDRKNRNLFQSLLFSAVSQLDIELTAKSTLIKQILDLIINNNNNNDLSVSLEDFLSDKSLIAKYESLTPLYKKCFDNYFNAIEKSTEDKSNGNDVSADETSLEVSAAVKRDYDLVTQYAANGRYDVAIPLCKHTLCKCVGQHTKADEYRLSEILGDMYFKRKQYSDCDPYLRKALDIRQDKCGPNEKTCIELKTKLSVALFEQKRYKEAELFAKEVLSAIHHNECDERQQSCVWELAEDLQQNKMKDYSLVSINNEHKNWYTAYDKYPMVSRVFAILIKIYAKNKKEIAAEVLSEVSAQLRQDLYSIVDNSSPEIKYQSNIKQHLLRRNTLPAITDTIGCQTDQNSADKKPKPEPTDPVVNKNSLFKKKILSALGKHYAINGKNYI